MNDNVLSSLTRHISPPPIKRRTLTSVPNGVAIGTDASPESESALARVEAGRAKVEDHLAYFTEHLSRASRITGEDVPRLSIQDFATLYERNQHDHGNHFVIHQHNHPRAGVHYDLRLQFSKSSSISYALPKGLPGNPNSKSLGRMAIETRVHNLWNHLIESASHKTGSLLIWDTGTYSILPRKIAAPTSSQQTTDCDSDSETTPSQPLSSETLGKHENLKLIEAFQTRYIRLRLHGTRLPKDYTVTLRLSSVNNTHNLPPLHQVRRKPRKKTKDQASTTCRSTDSESEVSNQPNCKSKDGEEQEQGEESLDTDEDEDFSTRLNNAYPGSTNNIGSIHQRKWFLMLDRRSSGFVPGKMSGVWIRDGKAGFEPFYVRGRDLERSLVTGRLAAEVESDEGVQAYVGRAGWTGIIQ